MPKGLNAKDWNLTNVTFQGVPARTGMVAGNVYVASFNLQDVKSAVTAGSFTATVRGVYHSGGKEAIIQGTDTINVIK
jgi:hypothetical protein